MLPFLYIDESALWVALIAVVAVIVLIFVSGYIKAPPDMA